MKQSQFYYLLRRGLFSAGSAIIKSGLVMFNKFTTAGLSFPAQGSAGFNGTSDFIDLGPSLDEQLDGDFTISSWVNTDATATQFVLNSITTLGTKIIAGIRFNDLGFWVGVDNGTPYWAKSGSALNIGEWYYLTATFSSSSNTIKIFINGSDNTNSSGSISGFGSGSGYVVIGKRNGNNDSWMDGNLANVAIWNRALSSDEINSVMWKPVQALTATESNGLQAWYSLDDIASPTASLASMEQLATDKNLTIENTAAVTAAVNSLS